MPRVLDLTDLSFGRLTAKEFTGKSTRHGRVWRCECKCGAVIELPSGWLTSGNTKSCGCQKRDSTVTRNTTHGLRDHKDYDLWYGMLQRCRYEKHVGYKDYGGRGIKVCDRWTGDNGFVNFLTDMGPRPSPNHTIDRYPNQDGDYEPSNCRWATYREQNRNKKSNRRVTYCGATKILVDWSEELKMDYGMLMWRLDAGWSVEKAFTTPSRKQRSNYR